MVVWTLFSLLSLAVSLVFSSVAGQAITTLTASEISAYRPYASYASAAYCAASTTRNSSCGTNCDPNPAFQPFASGGDGSDVQLWFVGYDSILDTVIVSHQGTDVFGLFSLVTDIDALLAPLDPALFPGVSSDVKVHSGFGSEQARTATDILEAVQGAIVAHSATSVTTTGHSLGATLSLLDALYLSIHLPSDITVKYIGFGSPRVGNQAFANLIDSTLSNRIYRVNNKEDLVPTVPGQNLGYVHPSGEKHILDNNTWVACPGQDNPSTECSTGDVTIFNANVSDHNGPYDGVEMGCGFLDPPPF